MTYKDFKRTAELLAKYNGEDNEFFCEYAEHDEYGFQFNQTPIVDEIKELRDMGWSLGCDSEYDEDGTNDWNDKETSDERLLELWDYYDGRIWKFA